MIQNQLQLIICIFRLAQSVHFEKDSLSSSTFASSTSFNSYSTPFLVAEMDVSSLPSPASGVSQLSVSSHQSVEKSH
jgi:hypothetical protein